MSAPPRATLPRSAAMPPLLFLGACPLLAASTTLWAGACMGVAAALVLCASAGSLMPCRRLVPPAAPVIFLLLLTAAWTSVLDLALQFSAFPMRQALGIYVPLIAANWLVLSTLEEHVLREGTGASLVRACTVAVWLALCVTIVAGVREFAGSGAGLAFLRAPAGAFLVLGMLAALLQAFARRGTPA